MQRRPAGDQNRGLEDDVLLQTVLSDYRHARTLLEDLTRDFRAREALLVNSRLSVGRSLPVPKAGLVSVAETGTGSPRVALFCMGKFQVEIDGVPVDTGAGGKALAILKFLAGRGRRRTPRDLLLEALWPDSDVEAAGNRLRVAMHGLRRLLAQVGGSLDIVTYQDGCYQLKPEGQVRVDADDFEALWRRGVLLERQGHGAEAAEAYAQAELLYGGDYLEEDLYEEWTLLRRESLRDAYLDLLGKLAVRCATEGDWGNCVVRCQKILAQDPCREDAYRLLMHCHAVSGHRSRALRWYEICTSTLLRELDAAPSPETLALYQRILRGEPL